MENLGQNLLCSLLPSCRAGAVPLPPRGASRARLSWGSVTQVPCVPQTSMPMFRSRQFSVKRRFSDFLGLYEKLSEKHAQNGFIVPPPPEKSLIGESGAALHQGCPSTAP